MIEHLSKVKFEYGFYCHGFFVRRLQFLGGTLDQARLCMLPITWYFLITYVTISHFFVFLNTQNVYSLPNTWKTTSKTGVDI